MNILNTMRSGKTLSLIKEFQFRICNRCKNNCSIQEINRKMYISQVVYKNKLLWNCKDFYEEEE